MEEVRMKNDHKGALALIGVFVVMMATRTQFPHLLEGMLISRPVSTILLLGGVAALYTYNLHTTALIAGLLSVYLLKTLWTTWPRSDERRLHLEVGRDNARFDPLTSIDLQFANGTAKHNLPVLLSHPTFPEMLVFPPSSETQYAMNG
jgi:hypothetical protein